MHPKWAAIIWADSDWLYLKLPSPVCDSAYSVKIPRTEKGLTQAIALLSQRGDLSTISTPGAPTSEQINQAIRKKTTVKPTKPRPLANERQRSTIRALMRKMELV